MLLCMYIGDGRFHMQSIKIANQRVSLYRKVFSREHYAHDGMQQVRRDAILQAASAHRFCIILGSLN